jgi:DNA-binding MarR family transcriptional regulator
MDTYRQFEGLSIYGQKAPRNRTLKGPEARLGFVLYRAGLAVSRGYERALAPINASPADAGVLSTLAYDGPNHTRALGRLLGLGRQTIVNVTKRLEEAGLISRSAALQDRRLTLFEITVTGKKRLEGIERIASAFDQQLKEILGSDKEAELLQMLRPLLSTPAFAHED